MGDNRIEIVLPLGDHARTFHVRESALVAGEARTHGQGAPTPAEMLRASLDKPFDLPPLRRALTAEDTITVLVDERLPHLSELVTALLGYLVEVGIAPERITLLCAPPSTGQPWLDNFPDELDEVRCEIHDPNERNALRFLSTLSDGQSLYLNRALVDADQALILAGCRFDPFLGHTGAAGAIYPTFIDQESREKAVRRPSLDLPEAGDWPLQDLAEEAAWVLGAPIFVGVIEGPEGSIAGTITGMRSASQEAQKLHAERWRVTLPRLVETAVLSMGGDPSRHDFLDMANAITCASRILQPHGRIILLTEADWREDDSIRLLRATGDPEDALERLGENLSFDLRAAWQWATVAEQFSIFIDAPWSEEQSESIHATHIRDASEPQRLIDASESCCFLADAHLTLATLES